MTLRAWGREDISLDGARAWMWAQKEVILVLSFVTATPGAWAREGRPGENECGPVFQRCGPEMVASM